jgi:toxin ParE1/3/4
VKLRYQSRACVEFYEAVIGYQEASPEAARKLVSEVERGLRRLQQFPLLCRRWHGEYRMMRPPTFPYGWFYRVEREEIVIYAVLHLHRDPAAIAARLRDSD